MPVLVTSTGVSLTGVIVSAKTVLPMLPPAPSLTVNEKLSLVTSLPFCV